MSRVECKECTRYMGITMCGVPYALGTSSIDDEEYFELKDPSDVKSSDGSCSFFVKKTLGYKIRSFFGQKLFNIKHIYYNIRSFLLNNIGGRIRYGFNLEDIWDLSSHISDYIHLRVDYLSDKVYGYPVMLGDADWVKSNNLEQYGSSDEGLLLWKAILKRISVGFFDLSDFDNTVSEEDRNETFRLMSLFYNNLFD